MKEESEKSTEKNRENITENKKPIANIMDKNRLKIREKIKEKIIDNQLKTNLRASKIIEIILSLGFILSFAIIFLMGYNGGELSEEIFAAASDFDGSDPVYALFVSGGAILVIAEKILSLGDYSAVLIFLTLVAIAVIVKLLGIYQAFYREKYKTRGITSQNVADCVIAAVLLINAIILAGAETVDVNTRLNMFIRGILVYDLVLTMLLVYGMNIRNNIKRYYKWKVESKKEL